MNRRSSGSSDCQWTSSASSHPSRVLSLPLSKALTCSQSILKSNSSQHEQYVLQMGCDFFEGTACLSWIPSDGRHSVPS